MVPFFFFSEAIKYGHDRIVHCLIRHGCSWSQDGAGDVLCAAVGEISVLVHTDSLVFNLHQMTKMRTACMYHI